MAFNEFGLFVIYIFVTVRVYKKCSCGILSIKETLDNDKSTFTDVMHGTIAYNSCFIASCSSYAEGGGGLLKRVLPKHGVLIIEWGDLNHLFVFSSHWKRGKKF